jgi:hypothetical protein
MTDSVKNVFLPAAILSVWPRLLFVILLFGTDKVDGEHHNRDVQTKATAECNGTTSCRHQSHFGDHTMSPSPGPRDAGAAAVAQQTADGLD